MRNINTLQEALVQLDRLGYSMKIVEIDSKNDVFDLHSPNGDVMKGMTVRAIVNYAEKLVSPQLATV